MSVTCLFGGTFNPPHQGHVGAALNTLNELGFDRLGLMPCKIPPHKSTAGISEQHRVEMVKRACEVDARLYPELIELSLPEPSYTVKTLQAIRQREADNPICFFMGEDSWLTLTTWYQWPELLKLAHLVVMRRPAENNRVQAANEPVLSSELIQLKQLHQVTGPAQLATRPCGQIYFAQSPLFDVSSTQLRQALATMDTQSSYTNPDDWLSPSVLHYIREKRLYV